MNKLPKINPMFVPIAEMAQGEIYHPVSDCPFEQFDHCIVEDNIPANLHCRNNYCWQKAHDVLDYVLEHDPPARLQEVSESIIEEGLEYARQCARQRSEAKALIV